MTPRLSSEQSIHERNTWKKRQQILNSFWKVHKDDYLLSLQQKSKLKLKSPRTEASETPTAGDIMQLKEGLL